MGNDAVDLKTESTEKPVERKWDLPEGVPPLFTFYLYLTNGCNLACRHCWITPTFVNGEPSPGDCLDLAAAYKLMKNERRTTGLKQAAQELGVDADGLWHTAHADALNTGKILLKLMERDWTPEPYYPVNGRV